MNEDELATFLETGRRPDGPAGASARRADDLRGLLADEDLWVQAPPDGADALLAAVRAESTRPRGAPRRSPGTLTPLPRDRWLPMALAAAAAALLVLGVVGIVARLDDGDGDDGRELAIAGTDLAPEASATATVSEQPAGVAIELDVRGLPPAPPDRYYQGWVKGPDGLVAVGTFHMRGGDDRIDLWSGVDLERYPTLTVTLQEEGAGPESSGRVVLTGEIGP